MGDDIFGEIRDENGVLAIGYESLHYTEGDSGITVTTVTCPIGYDGLVFQVGPQTAAGYEAYDTVDFTVSHTMDEFTENLDEFYYFSYTNE